MGIFSSEEEKLRKGHEKAMRELAWAFKLAGIGPQQLEGVLNGEEADDMLLTADELIWVRKGLFGGKLIGRIPRRCVTGFRSEYGIIEFETRGAAFPKNRFPTALSLNFGNVIGSLDDLSGGRLIASMTEEDRGAPLEWAKKMSCRWEPEAGA